MIRPFDFGNVVIDVSDKRIQTCSTTTVSYYTAEVLQATDYSPFGAPLPGRTYDLAKVQSIVPIIQELYSTTDSVSIWSDPFTLGTISNTTGTKLKYTTTAASAEIRYAVNTSSGRKYRVTLELERSTDVVHTYIDVRNIAQVSNTYTEAKATGHYTIDFMANSETMNIVVQLFSIHIRFKTKMIDLT